MTVISSAAEFALWLAHGKDRSCIYATIGNLCDSEDRDAGIPFKKVDADVHLLSER